MIEGLKPLLSVKKFAMKKFFILNFLPLQKFTILATTTHFFI